jgi:hypothetical protein
MYGTLPDIARSIMGELIEGLTPKSHRSEIEWNSPVGNEPW